MCHSICWSNSCCTVPQVHYFLLLTSWRELSQARWGNWQNWVSIISWLAQWHPLCDSNYSIQLCAQVLYPFRTIVWLESSLLSLGAWQIWVRVAVTWTGFRSDGPSNCVCKYISWLISSVLVVLVTTSQRNYIFMIICWMELFRLRWVTWQNWVSTLLSWLHNDVNITIITFLLTVCTASLAFANNSITGAIPSVIGLLTNLGTCRHRLDCRWVSKCWAMKLRCKYTLD